ncbi:O-antigen ligase family protein [Candidatus Omnitrophota bacterium]
MSSNRIRLAQACDQLILFSIYAIAFFLPISKAIIEALSIFAIFVYVLKKSSTRQGVGKSNLNTAVFVYLIICFFSIFVSPSFRISARTFFAKTLQNILFFFAAAETLNSKRRFRNFIFILFFSSLVLGVDGIYQYFSHKDFLRNRIHLFEKNIHASFHTPNDLACYLITVLPLFIVSFFASLRYRLSRLLHAGLFILLTVCLILTFSRGAWFGFLASVVFLSFWLHSVGAAFLILVLLILALKPFLPDMINIRLDNLFAFLDADNLRDVGMIERRVIWRAGWKMFAFRPLIGLGLGTFMLNFKKFAAPAYPYGPFYAHNCYLQMLSEIGILGLGSFLAVLFIFFFRGVRTVNSSRNKGLSWYVLLGSLAAILGYSVQMGVDTNLYSLDLGLLFWLILALGVGAVKEIREG